MKRILIVEDEPTIAIGLQDDLELEGFHAEVVSDGTTAVARALEGGYDLILLDVMLPGKDGFTVCREIQRAGLRTPIIMLTARGQEADKVTGLGLGADDYVTKPFSPRELVARIQAVLRRASEAAPAKVFEFGEVEIDFTRLEASRKGERVDLTATEFKLLRAFVEHRGRVLSIPQLLDLVWGKEMFLTDRVVYTHVNNLRGKIEEDPSRPRFIVSVRGAGYRFDG
ncbi:MAG: response regulator transcription factor [Acidobacteria bacterium]|nr:response regulator transcription factor [Acidobacteriota bacterium]